MSCSIVNTIDEVRQAVSRVRRQGLSVGLVPTMGALHEGHAALIRAAKATCDFVVVSVFVNPTQFAPTEDFSRYPRTLDADRDVTSEAGGDLIFAPTALEMYPEGSVTFVEVARLQDALCGLSRPGHFRGVCTVVMKLFQIVLPDVAVFGAKDYQQAKILERMVRDLNVPVRMQVEPTVREADGLALSSRNRYLTPEQRAVAPRIQAALQQTRERARQGTTTVTELEAGLNEALRTIPAARVDYARILDAETLQPIETTAEPAVAAVAVFLGGTRLIDNILLT